MGLTCVWLLLVCNMLMLFGLWMALIRVVAGYFEFDVFTVVELLDVPFRLVFVLLVCFC